MFWNTVQRFGGMIISFCSNLVLARLLTPSDYGIIGMIMVFISLSGLLVDGGLSAALIQKKEPTSEDYSTVFYWELMLGVFFYITLFLTAPAVADFYHMPLLSTVLRVQAIILIINAFRSIQTNQLVKQLHFRRLALFHLTATSIGAVTGIVMAFWGFGVWSLVAKNLIDSFSLSLLLWIKSTWRPLYVFSKNSFKELFSYGSLMLLSNLTDSLVFHVQSLIIGRVFSAKDLGFYTQARLLHAIPAETIPRVVNQVMFPVYSSLQDNNEKVVTAFKKSIHALVFFNFPLMLLLTVIAEPLIVFLYSDKWVESVPYFQILCFGGMLYGLNSNNVSVIKSLGKSNYIFITTLIKRGTTLLLIFIGLQFGIFGIVIGYTISLYLYFPINAYFTGRLTGYGILKQVRDIGPNYLLSVAVALVTLLISDWIDVHIILLLIFQSIIFLSLYLGAAFVFGMDGYKTYLEIIYGILNKKKIYGRQ